MTIAQGERMLASDILSLSFLPIGTILMHDGSISWTNDQTIPGWYKCDGNNGQRINDRTVPDLRSKFLCGADTAGVEGGSNDQSIILKSKNMPKHTHVFKGKKIDSKTGGLVHKGHIDSNAVNDINKPADPFYCNKNDLTVASTVASPYAQFYRVYMNYIPEGTLADVGEDNPEAITVNTVPAYYTVIYIIKMK
ncbi:MAG: hypothetical protein LBL50_03110 [Candidatus Margulisbacteria bacterium]|jgi:hypothetical protein|nr:hypothetical protein [Candidatus Margulisiibacteriota bacterium]